jgi:hypothetical protein
VKGKPRRDLGATCEILLKEFEESSEAADQYFGNSWKNHTRYCHRLALDLDERIKGTKDMAEFKTLSMYSKQILVLITICNYIKKLGLASNGFADLLESQLHFLKMDPAAEVRLPAFFALKRFEKRVECAEGSVFWNLLSRTSLMQVGYALDHDVLRVSKNAVRSRLLSIIKLSSVGDMMTKLQGIFPLDADVQFPMDQLHPSVCMEVQEVGQICSCTLPPICWSFFCRRRPRRSGTSKTHCIYKHIFKHRR